MGSTAIFQSETWAAEDRTAAPSEGGEGVPFLHDLMDRVRAGIDARDWPAVVLAVEQLIERTEAGEHDPAAPVLMIGWQRYRGIAPEIVCERIETLRTALRNVQAATGDAKKARVRRAAPNAESRAAKVIAQLNKPVDPRV